MLLFLIVSEFLFLSIRSPHTNHPMACPHEGPKVVAPSLLRFISLHPSIRKEKPMYIGPWQEYQLARAVGGPAGRRVRDSARQIASGPLQDHLRKLHSMEEKLDESAIDDLLEQLQSLSREESSKSKKEVILDFFTSVTTDETRDKQSTIRSLDKGPEENDISIDFSPFRTKWIAAEQAERLRAKSKRQPSALEIVEKRKHAFMEHLRNKEDNASDPGVSDNGISSSDAKPSIFPTAMPANLFEAASFKPSFDNVLPQSHLTSLKAEALDDQPQIGRIGSTEASSKGRFSKMSPAPAELAPFGIHPVDDSFRNRSDKMEPDTLEQDPEVLQIHHVGGESNDDDEVEALIDWTKSLGMNEDENYLFEDEDEEDETTPKNIS